MQSLSERYETLQKTLKQLDVALKKSRLEKSGDYFDLFRDTAIHRFNLCVRPFWKYLKVYLDKMGVKVEDDNPRVVFDACMNKELITKKEFELFAHMVEDAARLDYAHNQNIAEEIYLKIPRYYDSMKNILGRHTV